MASVQKHSKQSPGLYKQSNDWFKFTTKIWHVIILGMRCLLKLESTMINQCNSVTWSQLSTRFQKHSWMELLNTGGKTETGDGKIYRQTEWRVELTKCSDFHGPMAKLLLALRKMNMEVYI